MLPTTRQAVILAANLQKWPLLETHIFHNVADVYAVFWYVTCADRLEATSIIDVVGRDSSVGMRTVYGLGGPWIEYRWGRGLPHQSRSVLEPTQPPGQWA
jgi:hypothetical protein